MAFSITSAYPGEVLEEFKVKLVTGNETFQNNLVKVHDNVRKKVHVPRFQLGTLIQDRVETPVTATSQGTPTIDEVTIEPLEFMIYMEFNPRVFESYWSFAQPDGELVFRNLPPEIQTVLLSEISKSAGKDMGEMIWISDDTIANPSHLNKFDGLIKLAENDANVVDVATPVTLTAANIKGELDRLRAATDSEVWKHPDFKIVMGYNESQLYQEAIEGQANKGNDFTTVGPLQYWGKPIVPITGFTANTMYATLMSGDMDSNIHMAVDWERDSITDVLQVEKLQANSEKYFVKALMKGAVQHVWGEYITLYKA